MYIYNIFNKRMYFFTLSIINVIDRLINEKNINVYAIALLYLALIYKKKNCVELIYFVYLLFVLMVDMMILIDDNGCCDDFDR